MTVEQRPTPPNYCHACGTAATGLPVAYCLCAVDAFRASIMTQPERLEDLATHLLYGSTRAGAIVDEHLVVLVEVERQLRAAIDVRARRAVSRGATLTAVAADLGVTKQAAQKRYGRSPR